MPRKPSHHAQPWSERDVTVLENHWGEWPAAKLARYLGRTLYAVRSKAHYLRLDGEENALSLPTVARILGVTYTQAWNWTQAGLLVPAPRTKHHPVRIPHKALEAFMRQHPARVLIAAMDPAYPEWIACARKHCAAVPTQGVQVKRPWTVREDTYLRNQHQHRTLTEMAAYLKRSRHAVAVRLWRLRTQYPLLAHKRQGRGAGSTGAYRPWSPEEDAILLADVGRLRPVGEPGYGPRITLREVAARLGRPYDAAKAHRQRILQKTVLDEVAA